MKSIFSNVIINKAGLVFLIAIILLGGIIRYKNLTLQFTHIDDLLVATTILKKSPVEEVND